ncbi:hypothetical protein AAG570_013867 [Ranatra chinensis]|uniref:Uncharacterized protein n=1 Tax=Ranatra chinensis TaxID=642074 RepID=A0ABD0YZP9_9HEMI
MASKRRNIFHKNKTQETTEIFHPFVIACPADPPTLAYLRLIRGHPRKKDDRKDPSGKVQGQAVDKTSGVVHCWTIKDSYEVLQTPGRVRLPAGGNTQSPVRPPLPNLHIVMEMTICQLKSCYEGRTCETVVKPKR